MPPPHVWLSSFGRSIPLVTVSSFVSSFLGFHSHHAKVIHDWPMGSSGKLASHCVISSGRANKDMTGGSKVSPDQELRTQGSCAQLYMLLDYSISQLAVWDFVPNLQKFPHWRLAVFSRCSLVCGLLYTMTVSYLSHDLFHSPTKWKPQEDDVFIYYPYSFFPMQ